MMTGCCYSAQQAAGAAARRGVEGAVVVVIAGGGRRAREGGAPVGAGRAGPATPPRQPEATGAGGHRTMTGCRRLHARRGCQR
jgi:hypothetical protein